MRRFVPRAQTIVVAAALLLVLPGSASPGDRFSTAASAARPVLKTKDFVWAFAADGSRAAYPWLPGIEGCERAMVWNVATGRTSPLPKPPSRAICAGDWAGTEGLEVAVAAAAERVAWLAHGATNSSSEIDLYTARVGDAAARLVATGDGETFSGDNVDSPDRRIGLLVGDGETIVFATWTVRPGGKATVDERVWRLGPTGKKQLVGRFPDLRAVAVSGKTIAVLQGDARVTLVPENGSKRRVVVLEAVAGQLVDRKDFDLGLAPEKIVVLTKTSLAVFDDGTGSKLAAWAVPGAEAERGLLDVTGDLTSFLVKADIHVLRLTDGVGATVPLRLLAPTACSTGNVWAQLEPTGLFYSVSASYSSRKPGCKSSQLGLVPVSTLRTYLRPRK
jgi:hypothetical protein